MCRDPAPSNLLDFLWQDSKGFTESGFGGTLHHDLCWLLQSSGAKLWVHVFADGVKKAGKDSEEVPIPMKAVVSSTKIFSIAFRAMLMWCSADCSE
jgi:hypothetical protein